MKNNGEKTTRILTRAAAAALIILIVSSSSCTAAGPSYRNLPANAETDSPSAVQKTFGDTAPATEIVQDPGTGAAVPDVGSNGSAGTPGPGTGTASGSGAPSGSGVPAGTGASSGTTSAAPEKNLSVYTLVSFLGYGSAPLPPDYGITVRHVAGIDAAEVISISEGRYVNLASAVTGTGHSDHGLLIYDAVSDSFTCVACALKGITGQLELTADETVAADDISTPEKILFAVWNEKERAISKRFIYEPGTGRITRIPAPSENDFGTVQATSDFRYIVSHAARESDAEYDDVFLIDTLNGSVRNISGNYPTFMLSRFTPDGRFVMTALRTDGATENFDSEYCRFMVSETRGQTVTLCTGAVLRYWDGRLLTRDRDLAHHLYDLENGREIAIPEGTSYWDQIGDSLYRVDAYRNTAELTETPVSAVYVSDDGRTVYTYKAYNSSLKKRDLDGSAEIIKLTGAFAKDASQLEKTHDLFFSLQEKDGTAVLLYTASEKPKAPAASAALPVSNSMALNNVLNIGAGPASVAETVKLLKENYPGNDFGFKAVKGYGFLALYFEDRESGLTKVPVRVLVEDYRDGTFSIYSEFRNHSFIKLLSERPGVFYRRTLTSTDEETWYFLQTNRIPFSIHLADIDYATFYENGLFSEEKVFDYMFSEEYSRNMLWFSSFCSGFGIEVTSPEYRILLTRFLTELGGCGRQKTKMMADRNYSTFGLIVIETGLRLKAQKDAAGNFYVREGEENVYKVPEYVFADLIGLSVSSFAQSGFRWIGADSSGEYEALLGDKTAPPLTEKELRAALGKKLTADVFAGRGSEILTVKGDRSGSDSCTALVAFTAENGDRGFIYLGFSGPEKEAYMAVMCDESLRFCSDLLTEGFTGLRAKGVLSLESYQFLP